MELNAVHLYVRATGMDCRAEGSHGGARGHRSSAATALGEEGIEENGRGRDSTEDTDDLRKDNAAHGAASHRNEKERPRKTKQLEAQLATTEAKATHATGQHEYTRGRHAVTPHRNKWAE